MLPLRLCCHEITKNIYWGGSKWISFSVPPPLSWCFYLTIPSQFCDFVILPAAELGLLSISVALWTRWKASETPPPHPGDFTWLDNQGGFTTQDVKILCQRTNYAARHTAAGAWTSPGCSSTSPAAPRGEINLCMKWSRASSFRIII